MLGRPRSPFLQASPSQRVQDVIPILRPLPPVFGEIGHSPVFKDFGAALAPRRGPRPQLQRRRDTAQLAGRILPGALKVRDAAGGAREVRGDVRYPLQRRRHRVQGLRRRAAQHRAALGSRISYSNYFKDTCLFALMLIIL